MPRKLTILASTLALILALASPAMARGHPECDPAFTGELPAGHQKHGDKFCPDDITPPNTIITFHTVDYAAGTTTFYFEATEAGSTFECRTGEAPESGVPGPWDDGGTRTEWVECTSPYTYSYGSMWLQVFQVRAIDGAGNVDPIPAEQGFAPNQ